MEGCSWAVRSVGIDGRLWGLPEHVKGPSQYVANGQHPRYATRARVFQVELGGCGVVPTWGPDVSHPLLIASAADEELIVPPPSTAATERTFRRANVLRGLAVVLPHGDETLWEEEEQSCEDGLILSGELPSFEDVVIVIPGVAKGLLRALLSELGTHIRKVGLTPPSDSVLLAAEE